MRRIIDARRGHRVVATLSHFTDSGLRTLAGPVVTRYGTPTIGHLTHPRGVVYHQALSLINDLLPAADISHDELEEEFGGLRAELRLRQESWDMPALHDESSELTPEAGLLLYALVRMSHPNTVVETRVANGYSTFYLLNALRRNGRGSLHSIGMTRAVAPWLTEDERSSCDLIELGPSPTKRDLYRAAASLPDVDLFLHDSDHSYRWQAAEYAAFADRMRFGTYLVSDDVDRSFAFSDFCRARALTPRLLIDTPHAVGLVRL
jgi:hypothetical protein